MPRPHIRRRPRLTWHQRQHAADVAAYTHALIEDGIEPRIAQRNAERSTARALDYAREWDEIAAEMGNPFAEVSRLYQDYLDRHRQGGSDGEPISYLTFSALLANWTDLQHQAWRSGRADTVVAVYALMALN